MEVLIQVGLCFLELSLTFCFSDQYLPQNVQETTGQTFPDLSHCLFLGFAVPFISIEQLESYAEFGSKLVFPILDGDSRLQ